MERDIESRCIKLLLHQQPVARDLRQISAALKMITDMERIGDQAEDIAEIVTFLAGRTMKCMGKIENMARETIKMVIDSVDAFVKKDLALAENTLRIEVQASHNLIKSVCYHFDMEKTFANLFSYPVAVYTIESVLKRVYRMDRTMDFYTYQEAKTRVKAGSAAAKALYALATNHNISGEKYAYKCKQVAKAGIYPYCLLRNSDGAPMLKNPIALIYEKDSLYL